MALFFDTDWFDAALARTGLARADLARALGLSGEQIAEVWKDQRELSAANVAIIAALLAVPAEEIANHAGVSTPVPRPVPRDAAGLAAAVADLSERMTRLERTLAEVKALLLDMRHTP